MTVLEYVSNLKIQLYGGNLTRCPENWRGTNVSNAFHKIYFPIQGSGLIEAGGKNYRLTTGQIMLIPKGVRHSFTLTEEKNLRKYWLHFTALSDGTDLFTKEKNITIWAFSKKEEFEQAIEACEGIFNPPGESEIAKGLNRQSALFALFAMILEKSGFSEHSHFSKSRPAVLSDYIEEHLAEAIKVEDLARVAYMHPTAFIRYFKNQFGMPPLKYIKCLRLEKAKYYLENTQQSLSEIAERTGYRDTSRLSREFKLTYGLTPGQVKKEQGAQVLY